MATKKVSAAMRHALRVAADRTTRGFKGAVIANIGTALALQERGLVSYDRLTDAGYAEAGRPTLADTDPGAVQCRDDEGSYEEHAPKWDQYDFRRYCRRCDAELPDDD